MLTNLLRHGAPLIAQDSVIISVCLALLVWSVWSGIALLRARRKLGQALVEATRRIAATSDPVTFAAQYESVSAALSADTVLGSSWRGFRECLIVPSSAGRPVMATAAPRGWFDLASLFRVAGGDLRYHAALPGLLVGAGLLFTFLGLAAALSLAGEVVAEGVDQAQRNAALRNLLGAASVKFITSLAGMLCSIVYALFRKAQLRKAEESLAAFFSAVQDRMPFRSAATLQAEGNAVLERQYADVQRIGSDFFVNLGSTLEREFGEGLQQHIAPLSAAIDKLSAGLAKQNEGAMETMLKTFLERLEGAVGESMRGTMATLDTLGERLDGLQAGLDGAAQRMGTAAEEMAAGMGRGAETALGGINEQVGALVGVLREAAEEARHSNRAAGDDLARRMSDTAASLTEAVMLFQRRLEDGAAQGVDRLAAPIEALLNGLHDLSGEQRQAGAESTAAMSATIARAADALEATAAKVAEVLGSGAADASGRLVAATEAMRDDLRGVLDRFGATLNSSGEALTRGAAAGGDALRSASAGLGQELSSAAQRLRDAGEAAGEALQAGGAEARSGLVEGARTLVQGSAGVADRLTGLGAAADRLAAQVGNLDRVANAAASPLAASAADLRAAGEAARSASEPLRDVASDLRSSAGAVIGAATAIKAAQVASEQLAVRFGNAADRFGGLDQSLAGTLTGLGDSLYGLQSHVTDFVKDMDSGLSRSVDGLSAIAKSLEGSVEELQDTLEAHRA